MFKFFTNKRWNSFRSLFATISSYNIIDCFILSKRNNIPQLKSSEYVWLQKHDPQIS